MSFSAAVLDRRPARGCQSPRFLSLPPGEPDRDGDFGDRAVQLSSLAGLNLDPWQQLALRSMLRTAPGSNIWAAYESLLLCPRQNGKSVVLEAFDLAKLFLSPPGHLILHTAHLFPTAIESFRHLLGLVRSVPELNAEVSKVRNAHGEEGIELRNGNRLRFAARGVNGAGRGFSPDDVIFDEAYRLPAEAEEALLYAISAKRNPQLVYASSTGQSDSDTLWSLVQRGRQGDDESLMLAEWSADPDLDLADPEQYEVAVSQANPALGYRLDERKTRAEYRKALNQDRLEGFGRERLGWWADTQTETTALDVETWLRLADPTAPRGPSPVFAVSTAPDHSWSAVAVAWRRSDGATQVQVAEYAQGTAWVVGRVAELRERWGGDVHVDRAARGLVAGAVEPSGEAQAQADNAFADAVLTGAVHHGNQIPLDTAVRSARWRAQSETRVFDRKGTADISPLVAVALAAAGLSVARKPSRFVSF